MIWVTRFNGTRIYVNAEMIRTMEATPDTVITLTDNTKIVIKDPIEEVVGRVLEYQRIVRGPQIATAAEKNDGS